MRDFFRFIKTHFQRSANGLMQIILLNALSFFTLLVLKVVLTVIGYEKAYLALYRHVALPASWSACLYQPWALLTHCWVHVSFFSTLWGLLFLHTLGQIVVNRLGSRHFVALYLLGGLAGGLLFLYLYSVSPHFRDTTVSLSGFSGSLYAIMIAAATLVPQHTFSFFILGPLRLQYIAGIFVLFALMNLVGTEPATSVAALGGALLGYVYVRQYNGHTWWRPYWTRLSKHSKNLKVAYRNATPSEKQRCDTRVDQESLDIILDKVAASGYESLTATEKQQLFNAGK
ncbi:MAG: rhomboid family intramembrane serine protease [Amoebophilaceae bacterium]|jgi:membrane associated rhomboid family serine protease|nr:rhomboid family intramembrane serine protease [Amoebophilaceae bacterium]